MKANKTFSNVLRIIFTGIVILILIIKTAKDDQRLNSIETKLKTKIVLSPQDLIMLIEWGYIKGQKDYYSVKMNHEQITDSITKKIQP